VAIEFRIEEGDIGAFLDHHSQYSGAFREIRRRQLYGYGILFVIFGLVFWAFDETAVAIAFSCSVGLGSLVASGARRRPSKPPRFTGPPIRFDGPHA
jgi:dolichol kinase